MKIQSSTWQSRSVICAGARYAKKDKQVMFIPFTGLARRGLARLCALLVLWGSAHTSCADWTGFRNDGGSQVECQLPTAWSPTNGLAWQRELPGYGQSSPVILNEKVFVTAVEGPMKERLLVLCISLTSGQTLWSYELAATNQAASNFMASRAAPTPVVDERGVYAFFESGDCVAVDHAGSLLWHRDLTADEIPADFKPMLARIDSNGDGRLDQEELKAMADSFAARRSDSQTTARDPIVYGAAASQGKIVIRTGTRLYCIQ